ncbi:hypothetical protein V8B55DRAFT_1447366 [Mucor lusitanicus]
MPTHYQQHSFVKYSLKSKQSKETLNERQQDAKPSTRKKRRSNPPEHLTCKSPPKKHTSIDDNTANSAYDDLLTELEFSYDCLATINVVYTSLRHTYTESKWSIEQQGHVTRLCDMEKELLIAYDDLNLQINQLEKSIIKMELKLIRLKSM